MCRRDRAEILCDKLGIPTISTGNILRAADVYKRQQYVNEIAPALNKKFGYKSVMQIPKPVSYTHLDVYKRQALS